MKRILHYVGKMDVGGMESLLMSLYRNIDRTEYQFDFAVHSQEKGCFEDEILSLGGHIYRFPPMRKNPFHYYKTWKAFFANHYDEFYAFSVHTNSLANPIAIIEALQNENLKCILHSHSSYADKGKLQLLNNVLHGINKTILNTTRVKKIACSEEAARWLFGQKALNKDEVFILNNGIDYEKYRYSEIERKTFREELGITNNPVICQIGHLLPVKNHIFSLQLMVKLIEKYHELKLLVVGDGFLRERLIDCVKEKNLSNNVIFLGNRNDIPTVLSASDIFILPSLYEGLPVSTIEAQASGLQCVVSSSVSKQTKISNNIDYRDITNLSDWENAICGILERLNSETTIDREKIELNPDFDIRKSVEKYLNFIQ